MKDSRKKISIVILAIAIIWGGVTLTDYTLCKQAKKPIFAVPVVVTDCNMYHGLGYTIILRYDGAIGMSGEEMQGYFFFGWL